MTSPTPETPDTNSVDALQRALKTEYATVYSYGLVSAYINEYFNSLVATSLHAHQDIRDHTIELLKSSHSVVPLPALGYRPSQSLATSDDAQQLALLLEKESAIAWRVVVEQANTEEIRRFGVQTLTQVTLLASHWRQDLGLWPFTDTFPGSVST